MQKIHLIWQGLHAEEPIDQSNKLKRMSYLVENTSMIVCSYSIVKAVVTACNSWVVWWRHLVPTASSNRKENKIFGQTNYKFQRTVLTSPRVIWTYSAADTPPATSSKPRRPHRRRSAYDLLTVVHSQEWRRKHLGVASGSRGERARLADPPCSSRSRFRIECRPNALVMLDFSLDSLPLIFSPVLVILILIPLDNLTRLSWTILFLLLYAMTILNVELLYAQLQVLLLWVRVSSLIFTTVCAMVQPILYCWCA